jgi:hypothetical protein
VEYRLGGVKIQKAGGGSKLEGLGQRHKVLGRVQSSRIKVSSSGFRSPERMNSCIRAGVSGFGFRVNVITFQLPLKIENRQIKIDN